MQVVKSLNKLVSIFLVIILIIPIFSFPGLAIATAGNYIWAKSMGGSGEDGIKSIKVDSLGNVYTIGYFEGTVDFDPGAGTSNLVSLGASEMFISKLNSSGDFVWAKSLGGTGDDYGYSIALDGTSNIYITGSFQDTVDFDPGVGEFELTSSGDNDIFISKLNSSGDFVWAKSMGSVNSDTGYSISLDSSGNTYITGTFSDTVDFDPGAGELELISSGDADIFISKLNSSGDFIWAKSMGGISTDEGNSATIDSLGNVYITGFFSDTVDFDPGVGEFELTPFGGSDIFISKFDSSGNFVWVKSIGGTGFDDADSITLDDSGNVYTTGYFANTVDFDPGAGTSNLVSAGDFDIFISKLNSSGDFVWAKSMGAVSTDDADSIALDESGNVYTTGYFNGTVDFDPGAGTSNLVSVGNADVFISKLNSSGDFVWAKNIGSTSFDAGNFITTDTVGNLYVVGYFQDIADFDTGVDTVNLTPVGDADVFILKLGDVTPPTLSEVTPIGVVVNNETISYTFNTDEAGDITYGGSCTSATTTATVGNNTITFNTLTPGTYDNCTITVTDASNNASTPLSVSSFSIVVHSGGGGSSTPSEPSTPTETTPSVPTTPTENPNTETPTTPSNPTTPTTPTNETNPIIPKIECPSDQLITQNLKVDGIDGLFHKYTRAIVGEVKILQSYLNNFGFKSGKVDGIIGPITRGAIIRLQQYLNISPDGIVGPVTRGLINEGCE